ncbi:hypothetical protein DSM03_1088 [Leeuwenhoekiella aestuarii]|uniref:hypothetical protein n=1 Tax=Leeuwenhoekiella aestuarii TaxID=2249426 RepID=UPI000FFF47F0|nr:hypothetical protein [Leeuwenhoekiella aestuarii]RXG12863.1 hypothetical protein DSM03_1088 [Leeuwenhoekiella aestuarii]
MPKIIGLLLIFFFYNQTWAQDQGSDFLQGAWKLHQLKDDKVHQEFILNFKYSDTFHRYFGNSSVYGSITTLDHINFDEKAKTLSFSSHIRKGEVFNLKIVNEKFQGTFIRDNQEFKLTGSKIAKTNSNPVLAYGKYQTTTIPENIDELYVETGNTNSEIVVLYVQGGPFDKLQYTQEFNAWKNELHIVYVKQAQMINPSILPPENKLTYEDALKENLVSVEILKRLITHFKKQNKKVLVYGESYGAWIIQKYIAEFGNEADAVSISAGRLNKDLKILQATKLNQKVYDITYKNGKRIYTEMDFTYSKPNAYMLSSINSEIFTETLKDRDLSKLVVYQYGKKDGTVGHLDDNEIAFLQSKNVEIEVCKKCYHRQMLSAKIANKAIEKMIKLVK